MNKPLFSRAGHSTNAQQLFLKKIPLWKTAMDKVAAASLLLLASPVLLITYITIKISDPGPAFFVQPRMGRGGDAFGMYKFRSMVMDAEALKAKLMEQNERDGPAFKMTDDPRITPIGRFIRKWSIDELPQLYNVLKGDMSLVGPRPLPVSEDEQMGQWHVMRREVKPGITCLWQIADRDNIGFDEWIRLDIKYIRNLSFWLDIKILLLTIPTVLTNRGAK
ncbi:MAG: sugar transferase [Pontibacterium sp.]